MLGHAVVKGVASAAGKHAYDKAVRHVKSKKHKQNPQLQPSYNGSNSSNHIYPDAYCDGCGEYISDGIPHHCLECPNNDLCESCNSSPYIAPRNYSASGYSPTMCDVCGIYPIVGIRYKCLQCPDFDLCERCHNLPSMYGPIKGHTAYHYMLPMMG
jgi:hypothetical protein